MEMSIHHAGAARILANVKALGAELSERAVEFGERNAVKGEILVRVTPSHIVAVANVSD